MERNVYHGSPRGDIEELTAHRSTHKKECIYATDNKVVALLFAGKGKGDLDVRISNNDGKPELVERRPGVLKNLYDKEGYLYELDGKTFEHYDYLWSLEVISFEHLIKPLKKTYIPNILDVIRKDAANGNLTLYEYPDRPKDMPLDNSDLIEKYVRFEEQGFEGAVLELIELYPELESATMAAWQNRRENKLKKVKSMDELEKFLVEAKKQTYANENVEKVASSRSGSKDYEYKNGDMVYHDTYFGGTDFIGEEVVYVDGAIYWGMNYYGVTLDESLGEEAMDKALRPALMRVGEDDVIPVRGPKEYSNGEYRYTFEVEGNISNFNGVETIYKNGEKIYELRCNGGLIK